MKHKPTHNLTILIPNATSPRNIGDQAMLQTLLTLVTTYDKDIRIIIHSTDPQLYKDKKIKVRHTLYSWAVFKNRKIPSRCLNMLKLFIQYVLIRAGLTNVFVDKNLKNIVNDYKKAEVILFVGGGYLRSKKGITQTLNLLMQLFLFKFALLFSGVKIVAPISVGPFGYKWLEKTVINVLKQMDLVTIREEVSYKLLKKYKMKNIVLCSDHALMIRKTNKKTSPRKLTLGFTIRDWLKDKKSEQFEKSVANSLFTFSKQTRSTIQPIIQVDASKYGEDDSAITNRIVNSLSDKNMKVLKPIKIQNVAHAIEVYSNIDMLLGMRMHSNIIAATQSTPFAAISYEYKTEGIARQLNMHKYCIPCEQVTETNLSNVLLSLFKQRRKVKRQLNKITQSIRDAEQDRWQSILARSVIA